MVHFVDTDPRPLPQRITLAAEGKTALVLRAYRREAEETLIEDARLLESLGAREYMEVKVTKGTIRLRNGGVIWYLGGPRDYLEERVRGMQVQHVDGGDLLREHLAEMLVR